MSGPEHTVDDTPVATGLRAGHPRGHRVHRDGSVMAACGARFRPLLVGGRKALPAAPANSERVCPRCAAEGSGR